MGLLQRLARRRPRRRSWRLRSRRRSRSWLPDARTDPQRMWTRHLLIADLFGDEFASLQAEEIQFCVDAADVSRTREPGYRSITHWVGTYQQLWAERLDRRRPGRLSMLELVRDPVEEYELLQSYGVAQFLDYTGVDPDRDELPSGDQRFDYVVVSNVLTGLRPVAGNRLLRVACRLARQVLVVNVRGTDDPARGRRPRRLRPHRARSLVEREFGPAAVADVRSLLWEQAEYPYWPDAIAWTLTARRASG